MVGWAANVAELVTPAVQAVQMDCQVEMEMGAATVGVDPGAKWQR